MRIHAETKEKTAPATETTDLTAIFSPTSLLLLLLLLLLMLLLMLLLHLRCQCPPLMASSLESDATMQTTWAKSRCA